MTLIIPPGYAQCSVEIHHSALSRSAYVTFGADYRSAGGDFQGASDDSFVAFSTVHARIDSSCVVGPLTARVGTDSGENLVFVCGITPSAGGRAITGSGPPNVALLVEKLTARGGRRGRGRMFIPWAVSLDAATESGAVPSTEVTGWNTALETWRTTSTSSSVPLVLLHNDGLTSPGAPDLLTKVVCDPRFGSQRRRMGR